MVILGTVVTFGIQTIEQKVASSKNGERGSLQLFSLMKVILEQGDPFPDHVLRDHRKMRLVLGIFLLVGIVLSNGYKYENAYNMIEPRKPVKYANFTELVDANLELYTVTAKIEIFNVTLIQKRIYDPKVGANALRDIWLNSYFSNESIETFLTKIPHILVIPDFLTMYTTMASDNFMRPFFQSNKEIEVDETWYKKSGVHILSLDALESLYVNQDEISNSSLAKIFEKSFYDLERKVFVKKLKDKDKFALVTQWRDAVSVSSAVASDGGYMGKDSHREPMYSFQLYRYVSSNILMRLAKFKETGIVNKWLNLTEKVLVSRASVQGADFSLQAEAPKIASLDGNVVVIFSILLVGLATSGLVLVMELILNRIVHLVLSFVALRYWFGSKSKVRKTPSPMSMLYLLRKADLRQLISRLKRSICDLKDIIN